MRLIPYLLMIFVISLMAQPSIAQETDEAAALASAVVTTSASDGLVLVGDFYSTTPENPTVLLLHELYQTRAMWDRQVRALLDSSYNVLRVDLRGYGATGSSINWLRAVDDVASWLTWLRDVGGVRENGIFIMGSSMGSVLAIVGCGNDAACAGAIAISPGWRYYNVPVTDHIALKPVLVIYSERDRWPALGVPRMIAAAPETVQTFSYPGNAHGLYLLNNEQDSILQHIRDWVAAHQ